eukprot:GILJ01003504.1.p1 GENE.GILJ01003504.1~~GILJ01003504.1.p1  ORF type:complete len:176 (-),score=39.29 GILJ01003504.1:192-719(-)
MFRHSPFDEFFHLQDRMNKLVDSMWGADPFLADTQQLRLEDSKHTQDAKDNTGTQQQQQLVSSLMNRQLMHMNLSETENGYRVSAEMPGVNKEDIKLNVDHGVLSIEAEKKVEKKEDNERFHRVERSYGKYHRSFRLPENCDADQIQAKYVDGVLTVELGKKAIEGPRAKQIAIQ